MKKIVEYYQKMGKYLTKRSKKCSKVLKSIIKLEKLTKNL